MAYRIAFASSDGYAVDTHFGRAGGFEIAEIREDGSFEYLDYREVTACCQGCAGGQSEIEAFDAVLERLGDIGAVVVSKIGEGAANYLEYRGKAVYEAPFPIEGLLEKIIEKKLYEVDKWQSTTKN